MSRQAAVEAANPILIVGAGTVGLALGLRLQQLGIENRILDRTPASPWIPPAGFDARVYAISPSSRAFLSTLGVWQSLDAQRVGRVDAMEIHGDRRGRLHFGDTTQGQPLAHIVEHGALQAALHARLLAHAGDRARATFSAETLETGPRQVCLRDETGHCASAQLLVGADGAASWVRQMLGWETTQRAYGCQGVVINLACEVGHGHCARQWFGGGEVIALLPLGGNHVSLVWSATDAHALQLLAGDGAALVRALQARIGEPLGQLHAVSEARAFPLSLMRVQQNARQRVVLIGDAAHGVHPLAGQGLNLGLADAACLATVLAERGEGPDVGDASVLRRYLRRRAGPVEVMQRTTDGLHRLFDTRNPLLGELRNTGLDLIDRVPFLKTLLAAQAAGTLAS